MGVVKDFNELVINAAQISYDASNVYVYSNTGTVSGAGATDVFRFITTAGTLKNNAVAGFICVSAIDVSNGANQTSYIYHISTTGNGTSPSTLTQIVRTSRGTDTGVSSTPITIADDGAGGAVKIQYEKNGAISQVDVRVSFIGLGLP